MVSLKFYIPRGPILYELWLLHTRLAMPVISRLLPAGWGEVGSFLGPSISNFCRKYTLQNLSEMWARAGGSYFARSDGWEAAKATDISPRLDFHSDPLFAVSARKITRRAE